MFCHPLSPTGFLRCAAFAQAAMPFGTALSGRVDAPPEQLEIRRIHPDDAFVDLSIDFHNRVIARRRDAELFSFARNDTADELHFAPAALDVVVYRRGASV